MHRLQELYPEEFFKELGFKEIPKERNVYRGVERIGMRFNALMEKYQEFIKNNGLASNQQFMDFSSSYFEGTKSELGALGYSRDSQPGKKQITWGISTGINEIPAALTIQKGNLQDKKHFGVLFKTCEKILPEHSLLIFDCGANTKKNKDRIMEKGFHYLTLKQKKKSPYKKLLKKFRKLEKVKITVNGVEHWCVKLEENGEFLYIFFSKKLKRDQLWKKRKKFKRELEKNHPLISKAKRGKELAKHPTDEGYVIARGELQKTLGKIKNPFITGLEGFFILESSVDAEPEKILKLYKEKDKAEKLIRNMKEGTELRPIRHWSKFAVTGYLFIVFLTNCITSLAQFLSANPLVKNVKLLKKYLSNLTLTVVYPKKAFQLRLLSNISPEIETILGKNLEKYGQTSIDLRW
ncbi:MAG: hypothetical protein HY392_03450 [Candidatus Diapherotrites archaeon]|nr:hypothetical protein [Candidatus Diapherotrites archaeon]